MTSKTILKGSIWFCSVKSFLNKTLVVQDSGFGIEFMLGQES